MKRILRLCLLASSAACLCAQTTAEDFAERVRKAGLDARECYRVRDLTLIKEDIRLYLTEGFLILGNEIDGRRHSAVFSGEVEGGDGEVLIMPPMRSERLSLATFTESPNLNEHFRFMLMVFSDDTAETLRKAVLEQPRVRRSEERGVLLADRWSPVVGNMSRSFGTRLVYDVLSERPLDEGFFYAAVRGSRLGNFDVVYDPASVEQIQVGQVQFRENRAFFDVWTSFASRSFRTGARMPVSTGFDVVDYRINATLEKNLKLAATTEATITVADRPLRVLYFDISPRVKVTGVEVDGQPSEVWQRSALRANLFGGSSGLFLVVAPDYLAEGEHTVRFEHEGRVVRDAGNGVYYVGSRSSWYPYYGLEFCHFDITFRYPEDLNLVFTGEILEDRTEDEWRVTRRRTTAPIRLAGFNVGRYEHVSAERESYTIEVYANMQVEQALEPERRMVMMPRPAISPSRRQRVPDLVPVPAERIAPDPTARLEPLAEEVGGAVEFMLRHFGAPPTRSLMVSPIPGGFGQGFPGLLYLSTMAYLEPEDRPERARDAYQEYFYSEILHAHEAAHQWWGNVVTTIGYQDGWLMEALANYSALLLLEQRKGPNALASVLDQYRRHLLRRNEDGKTFESAGPITWGPRLNSSQATAFRIITYEKGSWIMHMLRRRLGDEPFLKMLGDLCREYRYRPITTDEFRRHAARYLPEDLPDRSLENFFDQWVYDTGVPTFEVNERIRGQAPRVRVTTTVRQSGVPDYFSALVPVDVELSGGKVLRRWLTTSEEPATLDITLPERPANVVFNPGESVLASRK